MLDIIAPFVPLLLVVLLTAPAYWRIWRRTGNSGWWGLLSVIPLVSIAMAWWLAYKRWPALEDTARTARVSE